MFEPDGERVAMKRLPDGRSVVSLAFPFDDRTPHGPVATAIRRRVIYPYSTADPTEDPSRADAIAGMQDEITVGLHAGTHMDSLLHVSVGGERRTDDILPVFVGRGLLLDFPKAVGVDRLPDDVGLAGIDIARLLHVLHVSIRPGDAVLIRTGRDRLIEDVASYEAAPFAGLTLDGARMLADAGATLVGSDTMPFEQVPSEEPLAVHAELLFRRGIPILEMLDLRLLSAIEAIEFELVVSPLPLRGASGSPVNPIAIIGP